MQEGRANQHNEKCIFPTLKHTKDINMQSVLLFRRSTVPDSAGIVLQISTRGKLLLWFVSSAEENAAPGAKELPRRRVALKCNTVPDVLRFVHN